MRLGADAWALTAADAATILADWRSHPPSVTREPIELEPGAICLVACADELGRRALDGLAVRFPPMAGYDARQMARTREDLVFNLGVPPIALITGLEVLRPLVEAVGADAVRLLDAGRQQLLDGSA